MTINHGTQDNGGSLTEELEPSEQTTREVTPSQTKEDKASELVLLLSLDTTREEIMLKCLLSMEDLSETSETSQDNAWMFMEEVIQTIDMLPGGPATTMPTKDGASIPEELISQDTQ